MREAHRHKSYAGLTRMTKHGPVWTGEVRLVLELLDQPLRWKKPRRIFVSSMSDLFHENVPDEFIDKVFAVMALAPQHVFQCLTKRSKRMRDYLQAEIASGKNFPLRNVWLGVSIEDQKTADERITQLLETPAAVRFISAEPLLGLVQFPLFCKESRFWSGVHWIICGGETGPQARPFHLQYMREPD